jgi:hypothetical protein
MYADYQLVQTWQGRAGKTFPVFLAVGDLGKKQRKFRE